METRFDYVSPEEVEGYRDQILDVYRTAFGSPPYNYTEGDVITFSATFTTHLKREDFRCVIARQGEQVVGFTYGYTSTAGQWWYDTVTRGLSPHLIERWFQSAFEVVELAVTPPAQGNGFGGCLHDLLLEDLPHKTAVLTTLAEETTASQLYRKRGWELIREDLNLIGSKKKIAVLGLDLNKR